MNGDGCFMMHGQELATAMQYGANIIAIVINNGMLGTIRMHQEREYPGRTANTGLRNPDFAALARAYGARCSGGRTLVSSIMKSWWLARIPVRWFNESSKGLA